MYYHGKDNEGIKNFFSKVLSYVPDIEYKTKTGNTLSMKKTIPTVPVVSTNNSNIESINVQNKALQDKNEYLKWAVIGVGAIALISMVSRKR